MSLTISLSLTHITKFILRHAEHGHLINKIVDVRRFPGYNWLSTSSLTVAYMIRDVPLRHLLYGYVKHVCSTVTMYGYQLVLPA